MCVRKESKWEDAHVSVWLLLCLSEWRSAGAILTCYILSTWSSSSSNMDRGVTFLPASSTAVTYLSSLSPTSTSVDMLKPLFFYLTAASQERGLHLSSLQSKLKIESFSFSWWLYMLKSSNTKTLHLFSGSVVITVNHTLFLLLSYKVWQLVTMTTSGPAQISNNSLVCFFDHFSISQNMPP